MAVAGERFHLELDSQRDLSHSKMTADLGLALLGDIKERTGSSTPKPPLPPSNKGSKTGFPAHKIRKGSLKFRQRGDQLTSARQSTSTSQSTRDVKDVAGDIEKEGTDSTGRGDPTIDEENKQRLAAMSSEDIEEARQELMAGLNPSLIEKLLKKANIDGDQTAQDIGSRQFTDAEYSQPKSSMKHVTFEDQSSETKALVIRADLTSTYSPSEPDRPPIQEPSDLHPVSTEIPLSPPHNFHFPKPPKAPDLDPSDPDFLEALHKTYFPSLSADPSTLAWMAPIDAEAETESAYAVSQDSLLPSALRFDFRGHLLPPRLSAQIPPTKGLHHHAHAPLSAGYTIPELAHLARSSYPAQRCIAYQTLGRILYRLGRGDFGQEGDDLCEALWQLMDQGRAVEGLVEVTGNEDGNRSVWATATEAVWLWQKGGGRRWKGR